MNESEIKQSAEEYADSQHCSEEKYRAWCIKDFIAGAQSNATKWIDVNEARPANPRVVIVVNAGKVMHGYYFEGKWYYNTIEQPLNNVTHYCEFPSPPNTQP